MRRTFFSLLLSTALFTSTGTVSATPANTGIGKHLYRSYCYLCHGANGNSVGPLAKKLDLHPTPLGSPKYRALDTNQLAKLIGEYGQQLGSMKPNWNRILSPRELHEIATYLAALLADGIALTGNTRRGRAIFRSACAGCHGAYGTGEGALSRLMNTPMVDYTRADSTAALSDRELVAAISDGRGEFMPSWREVLSSQEIADVAAYVRQLSALALAPPGNPASEPNPLIGQQLYHSYCLVCHGPDGASVGPLAAKLGLTPPNLMVDRYQLGEIDTLVKMIGGYGGRAGSPMPNWGDELSEANLRDIAAFVYRLGDSNRRVRGDTRRGRAIYKSACAACHGEHGKGNGLLAVPISVPMLDYTDPRSAAKMSDEQLQQIIHDGKGSFMPAWKEVFDDAEIGDVAAYVRLLAQ